MKGKLFAVLLALMFIVSAFAQTVHQVAEGTDGIQAAYDAAADGDVIELTTDGGLYTETSPLTVEKSITIRAAAGLINKPIVRCSDASDPIFKVTGSTVRLHLMGIEFDGTDGAGGDVSKYFVILDNDDIAGTVVLKVEDCISHDYTDKHIKSYPDCGIDSILVDNSIFYNGKKEGITLYSGSSSDNPAIIKYASFTNSTFYGFKREAIKGQTYDQTKVIVDRCTFYDIGSDKKGMVYFRNMTDVEVKNSIFVKNQHGDTDKYADFASDASLFHHNSFFDVDNEAVGKATVSDTIHLDPEFVDAENADFTLPETSPLLTYADDGGSIGDPRWDPTADQSKVYPVYAGVDVLKPILDNIAAGDVIELMTSGGMYLSTDQLVIDKDVTIRGNENLLEKPVLKYTGTSTSAYMFKVIDSPKVKFMNLEFDGNGTGDGAAALAKYALRLDNADTTGTMKVFVDDCVLHDFNEKIIKPYANCGIDSLIIHNTIFYNGAKEGITLNSGSSSDPAVALEYVEIENCTFYGFTREAIKGDTNLDTKAVINQCTFYDCGGPDKPFIYMDDLTDVVIKNSIFQMNNETGNFLRLESDANIVNNIVFWDVNDIDIDNTDSVTDTLYADPLFADPVNGDFTLAASSPARTAGEGGLPAGDLRWAIDPNKVVLTVELVGSGNVTLDPPGKIYDPGTQVTLTAVPEANWQFAAWNNVLVFPPNNPVAVVTINTDTTITATFEQLLEKYALDVSVLGDGYVEFDPAPLDSADWTYFEGTDVTMTAVSDTSTMAFTGWSGDVVDVTNPVVVTMDSTINVLATFTPTAAQVTLDVDTVGLGHVLFNPRPYADYGTYDVGTSVTLMADPQLGFEFSNWSGDQAGTDTSLVVQMDADKAITATFVEIDVPNGILEVAETMDLLDANEFAHNNSQVHTVMLTTDGGYYPVDAFIGITKDLTFIAKEDLEVRPMIEGPEVGYSSGLFQIKAGGSLMVKGLELYNAKYLVRTDDDSVKCNIKVDDCYVHDAGEVWIKVYVVSWVDSLIITNSIFKESAKEGIYLKEVNTIGYVKLENSTFLRAGREALRMRGNDDAVVEVNHCTFDSTSWNADYRVIYPENVQNVEVKNSIITNKQGAHSDALRLFGTSSVHHMDIFNSGGIDLEDEATADSTTIWTYDPLFTDPVNMDYSLMEGSPAIAAADDGENLGDLNWKEDTTPVDGDMVLAIPDRFALHQNYPNPFNPSTAIRYDLPKESQVTLSVYNIMGHRIRVLVNEVNSAGSHSVTWDGLNEAGNQVASGIYFYHIETKSFNRTLKMMLLK